MRDKHMGVAEVKRNFADVVGQVMYGNQRIVVNRRGRPVVAIVPLDEAAQREPGQRLAAAIGCGEQDGETFRGLMKRVVDSRRRRLPRRVGRSGR
jgi:prevent-host-death family protein